MFAEMNQHPTGLTLKSSLVQRVKEEGLLLALVVERQLGLCAILPKTRVGLFSSLEKENLGLSSVHA